MTKLVKNNRSWSEKNQLRQIWFLSAYLDSPWKVKQNWCKNLVFKFNGCGLIRPQRFWKSGGKATISKTFKSIKTVSKSIYLDFFYFFRYSTLVYMISKKKNKFHIKICWVILIFSKHPYPLNFQKLCLKRNSWHEIYRKNPNVLLKVYG